MEQRKSKEETAIVLDFLPHGYPFDPRPSHKKTPIVQAIGKKRFTLLELCPKKDVFLQPNQEVYIGEGKRDEIHHILGRLPLDKLTNTGRHNLDYVVKELVKNNELKTAKEKAIGRFLFQIEAPEKIAEWYGVQEIHQSSILGPDTVVKNINAVTSKNVKRVAKKLFTSRKLNLSIIGPVKNDKRKLSRLFKLLS